MANLIINAKQIDSRGWQKSLKIVKCYVMKLR